PIMIAPGLPAGVTSPPAPIRGGFFFQAEDGIRGKLVTGVQTCALPIWIEAGGAASTAATIPTTWRRCTGTTTRAPGTTRGSRSRSEERRVGKERKFGGGAEQLRKKKVIRDRQEAEILGDDPEGNDDSDS